MILIFSRFSFLFNFDFSQKENMWGEGENGWFAPALLLPEEWNVGKYTGGNSIRA
jgi:hypothetical protein